MNRLISLWIGLFCLSQAAGKPNIVVIFCDDMGYGDIGSFGAKGWNTPNIDSIAQNGVKLTDFYVAQPVCSASRCALLTGCYPNRLGISGALFPASNVGLHPDETTLAEICKSVGYQTAMYGDVIQEIDWSTGEVLAALDKAGVTENTLVVFTSDNGPWMVYGNHAGGVGPLRGAKGTCWDGGVRVPCVMQWPAKLKAGSVVKTPLMTIDLLPTITKLIGAKLPERKIDGKDAWKVIAGKQSEPVQEAYFFWYKKNDLEAMRMGRWKLQFPHKYRDASLAPGKDGLPGKHGSGQTGLELFDLETDPGESKDLSAEHPEVVTKMKALADRKRAELGDNLTKIKGTENRQPGNAPVADWAKMKK